MAYESSDVVRFDLRPLVQGHTRIAKLKSAYNLLILVLEVCNVKPTHGKSLARNPVMWSHKTLGLSFNLQQGYAKLKSLVTRLLSVLQFAM